MGFFSKIFKGIKKVFKKIGKGIKSAFKSVGKFMGKIGILGQIGLGLLLPGLGQFLGSWAGTLMGSSNVVARAAGQFINASINIGTKVGKTFKTITEGVTSVIGETVGAVANNLGLRDPIFNLTSGKIDVAGKGFNSIFDKVGEGMTNALDAGKDLFSTSTLTDVNPLTVKSQIKESIKNTGFDTISEESVFNESGKVKDLGELLLDQKETIDTPNPFDLDYKLKPTTSLVGDPGEKMSISLLAPQDVSGVVESQMSIPEISETTKKYLDTGEFVKKVDIPTGEKSLREQSFDLLKKEAVESPAKFINQSVAGLANKTVGNVPTSTTNVRYGAVPTIPLETYQPIPFVNTLDPMQYISDYNSGQGFIGHTGLLHDVHSAVFSERMKG